MVRKTLKKENKKGPATRRRQLRSKGAQPGSRKANLADFESRFPIVGVGASAGGLEAFEELLRALPEECGMAFVLVQHLSPQHSSMLDQILARSTHMKVQQVTENMRVERDHVYIIPPNTEMSISGGVLHLSPRSEHGTVALPIDHFFRSLAEDQGNRGIGVILSGSASDGALGTKAIKAEGGIVFVQDQSAKYDGMPRSALAAGSVDFVLSPRGIARELARICKHPYLAGSAAEAKGWADDGLAGIYALLQKSYDVDFAHYKPATIERRIRRRMALHRFDDLRDYVALIQNNPGELEELYHDILIKVTGFFRDPEVFEFLKKEVFPSLIRDRDNEEPVRIWVPGCATGEEAYSLAITFLELTASKKVPVQVFGTDVSEVAIVTARAGTYPENIAGEVSPARLERFFARNEGQYRISKKVRDLCVFARQNVTKDPPFSRLDLISCRNLMIYLGNVLQRKVLSIFHYALKPSGFLILGSSETIGSFADLFEVTDRKHRLYKKKVGAVRPVVVFGPRAIKEKPERVKQDEETPGMPAQLFREADRILLSRFSPAGVLINDQLEILQFRGKTSPFLEPAPGTASFDLFKMAREGLAAELRTSIHRARKTGTPVRRAGIHIKHNNSTLLANIEVIPFTSVKQRYFLVLFELTPISPEEEKPGKGRPAKSRQPEPEDSRQLARLQRKLEATREYLQSIIEEQEVMNKELRSANEESQSSNEELQSTNEELETAKEELQSSNEELITLNEEMDNRNAELNLLNSDLINLLSSVDIPILMLDNAQRIRRFNPTAQKLLRLLPSDIGRPISDMKTTLKADELESLVAATMDRLTMQQREVHDREGRRYSVRVRPYKTIDNKIDGAVVTLFDFDRLKQDTEL